MGSILIQLARRLTTLTVVATASRSLFQTADLTSQGRLLNDAASLLDAGVLRTTANDALGKIKADNLKKAHAKIESGRSQGKLVLEGF